MPEGCLIEMSTVSVSIVTYQTDPDELLHLLDQVAASSYPVDLVVVDNSPSDTLRAAIKDRRMTYLHPGRNLGFGGGHNLALMQSLNKSKYHIIANPDIQIDTGLVGKLFDFMEDHPDVGLVMPAIRNPDGSDQGLCKRLPTPADLIVRRFLGRAGKVLFRKRWERYELKTAGLTAPCEVPCLSGCFMFLRCAVLRKVGLFDERFFMYMEDVDLCRRIGQVAKCIYYPSVAITHGYAQGSYRNLRLLRYHASSALRYFSKWGWCFDADRDRLNRRAGTAVYPITKVGDEL
jgi:GT2 family glycosyltransferase